MKLKFDFLKYIAASGRPAALFFLLAGVGVIVFCGSLAAQKSGKPARGGGGGKVVKPAAQSAASTANDALPRKSDDQTAVSPIYPINSKNCRRRDAMASEGDEFYRECSGYGDYLLRATGSDYRINYGIVSKNPSKAFEVMLFPLEEGAAERYVRADLYDEKLAEKIEWRLDERGAPYAIIVRAAFYKNTGSAKTFANPKNKAAEFVFVRGLAGFEDLKEDLPTTGTAYNPLEQARAIAADFLARRRKQ